MDNKWIVAANANKKNAEKAFLLASEAKEQACKGLDEAIEQLAAANAKYRAASAAYKSADDALGNAVRLKAAARAVIAIVEQEPHLIPEFLAEAPSDRVLACNANSQWLLVAPLKPAEWSTLGLRVRDALAEVYKVAKEAE